MMKGSVMFASLRKRDSRAHALDIEPKPMSTSLQNEILAVAFWDTLVFVTFEWLPDPRLLIRDVPI